MTIYVPKRPKLMSIARKNGERISALLNTTQRAVAVASEYPGGYSTGWHSHDRSQLIYAVKGVLEISTDRGMWITPPLRALWVPADIAHKVNILSTSSMRSLYILPDTNSELPGDCCVIHVSPLLRELLLYLVQLGDRYDERGEGGRALAVILDQLLSTTVEPLNFPTTDEPHLRPILDAMKLNPAENSTLQYWADQQHTGVRTLSRLFTREMGMGFSQCRHQIRLLTAIGLLAQDRTAAQIAHDVGFSSQSNFIKRFKKSLGVTPKQYFEG